MLKRFNKSIVRDYIFDYEIPESFYDDHVLNYLKEKCFYRIKDAKEEISKDLKAIASGIEESYHYLRKYFYENFVLRQAQEDLKKINNKHDYKFKESKNIIDIETIKNNVKCEDLLGKPDKSDGKRLWYKLRNERTASCCVYTDTNSFYDFGSGDGGSSIDLFMKLNDCDFKTAIRKLNK